MFRSTPSRNFLVDAGNVCAEFHDEATQNVKARRVQVDEIWSFTYAKAKNVGKAKKAPQGAGDTWTGLDADFKGVRSKSSAFGERRMRCC